MNLFEAFIESYHNKVVRTTAICRIIMWRTKLRGYGYEANEHYDYTIAYKMLSGGDYREVDVPFTSLEHMLQSLQTSWDDTSWLPLEQEHARITI